MLFSAEISDFKLLYNVLKAISFKEYAILRPMEEGLKLTLEEMKCIETTAYIPCDLFSSYHIDTEQDIKFKINLKIFTECLFIFGDDGNPSLKMSYKDLGSPLRLILKHSEEDITVDCDIKTMDVGDFSELSLADECNLNKIVLNAQPLVEVLQGLDSTSDELELMLSPDPPYFKISTNGLAVDCVFSISKQSEMVTLFQCSKTTKSKYAFSYIKQILKAMSYANKVSISTGESELLGLQLFIKSDEKQMYIEYYVTAQFADD